jgi:maltose-binding protein MalE
MRWVIFIIALLYLLMAFMGCNLFKKTTKSTSSNAQSTAKQADVSQLILKTANKETQIFTYWKDSALYQYQNIKEHIEEAKSSAVKVKEEEMVKRQRTIKKAEPARVWVYIGVLLVVVGGVIVCSYKF